MNSNVHSQTAPPTSSFNTTDFLARLAALVPRPRAHLTRYHGVFAPNFKHRKRIVPKHARKPERLLPAEKRHNQIRVTTAQSLNPTPTESSQPTAPLSWAERLKRVFEIDLTICPFCGGNLRVIADITQPDCDQQNPRPPQHQGSNHESPSSAKSTS